jgi:hypothetical protein
MPADVIINPTSGEIYWNDSGGATQSISIRGDSQNKIDFIGYSSGFSPASSGIGTFVIATFNDNSGTSAFTPGTSGFDLGTSVLRWNTFASNANLSGVLTVGDSTNTISLTTGSVRLNGGIAISSNASIGQTLLIFNGANYSAFRSGATGNTTYTLPTTSPAIGSSVLSSTAAGVMSWVPLAASGGGGVATGVANRMAYYATAGSAVTDSYGFEYTSAGQGQTISVFGGAAIGNTIFVISAPTTTTVRVGIGVSNPQFQLEVNGEISATNKSFVINHPTKPGMKLRYGSLEGPENGVYIRGISTSNIIYLPDYWLGLVDYNTITVHLTPIGKNNSHYFLKCEDNKVYIGTSLFKKINCFYSIWAERKDIPKLTVEY